MMSARWAAIVLLTIAIVAGTAADQPRARTPITIGGYRVLAADFHTHSSMWSDGSITPWGMVLEAQRQGLDAIAITGHNRVEDSQWGRSFARRINGPIVLTGQEILTADHHIIAVGIETTVNWKQRAAGQIDDIHRQGGIAIAAHPVKSFWPGFDDAAVQRLDGAEICHPLTHVFPDAQQALEQFATRGSMAAIGSSDFHGLGPLGLCRTFVFATDASEAAILEAIRARRTVVYGLDGTAYGDPTLIALAEQDPRLREAARPLDAGWLDWISRVGGVLGLIALTACSTARHVRGSHDSSRSI